MASAERGVSSAAVSTAAKERQCQTFNGKVGLCTNDSKMIPFHLQACLQQHNGVGPHHLVDAQRTPLRIRTTGFLGTEILFICLV
jgi:hypothetical protein